MPSFRTGVVTEVLSERSGLQRVTVDGERAYVLTALTGPVAVGDAVVVNTTAVDLGLGSGGEDFVLWNLERPAAGRLSGGHILKLRYTPWQIDTEADSLHSYFDKVCLVQISIPHEDYVIDPLAKVDLAKFGEILANPKITKIFHGGDYDVRILNRDFSD